MKHIYLTSLCLCLGITYSLSQQLSFVEDPTAPFFDASSSRVILQDLDGDGDLDAIVAGHDAANTKYTKLYENDGNGNFTEVTGTPFAAVDYPDFAFGDVDGDGKIDIVMTGMDGVNGVTHLYKNQGNLTFTNTLNALQSVWYGAIDLGDIDGDGDLDLVLSGYQSDISTPKLFIYKNNGNGAFAAGPIMSGTMDEITSGSVKFIDADEDGDLDLLVVGLKYSPNASIAKMYMNNGSGSFTFSGSNPNPFTGTYYNSIDVGDVNNDGHLDIIITGQDDGFVRHTILYLGNGTGYTVAPISSSLLQTRNGDAKFADFNNDGNLDLIITGDGQTGAYQTKVYLGDGQAGFTEETGLGIVNIAFGKIAVGDVNGDGKVDILISGTNGDGYVAVTKLYLNDAILTPPCTPSIPSIATLSDITAECPVDLSTLTPPTSESDCDGTITGILDAYPVAYQDTTITWSYTDSEGNVVTQTQNIVITPIDNTTSVANNTITANATGNYTYYWTDCDNETVISGETTASYTPTTSGSYSVTIVSSEGCSVSSACVNISTSSLVAENASAWNMYPNPTHGALKITTNSKKENQLIKVYSVVGEVVFEKAFSGNSVSISLEKYPNGIYFIEMNGQTKKIVRN
ncbi:MAG: FG-GAP-like repeat-containing protein [Brumimicrobium sp.]|nr:FG-GAP-like repeat-containing protein [Brumimicrobium sp.]